MEGIPEDWCKKNLRITQLKLLADKLAEIVPK